MALVGVELETLVSEPDALRRHLSRRIVRMESTQKAEYL